MTKPPFLTFLTGPDLGALGLDPKWRFGMTDRVRFSEIDALNHVNNTVPLRWFESLRMHYLSYHGISTYDQCGPQVVIRGLEATFHAPLFVGEEYLAVARTATFRRTSLRMEYAVFAPDLRVSGAAIVVLLDADSGAKTPLTAANRTRLTQADGALPEGT